MGIFWWKLLGSLPIKICFHPGGDLYQGSRAMKKNTEALLHRSVSASQSPTEAALSILNNLTLLSPPPMITALFLSRFCPTVCVGPSMCLCQQRANSWVDYMGTHPWKPCVSDVTLQYVVCMFLCIFPFTFPKTFIKKKTTFWNACRQQRNGLCSRKLTRTQWSLWNSKNIWLDDNLLGIFPLALYSSSFPFFLFPLLPLRVKNQREA